MFKKLLLLLDSWLSLATRTVRLSGSWSSKRNTYLDISTLRVECHVWSSCVTYSNLLWKCSSTPSVNVSVYIKFNVVPISSKGRERVWIIFRVLHFENFDVDVNIEKRKHFFFFYKFLEDFLWGHWYPYFGLLVMSSLGFKARVGSALFKFSGGVRIMLHVPWDSPLGDTCRPLGSQHGSQAISSTHLRGIGGTQTGSYHATVWDQAEALPTELSRLSSEKNANIKSYEQTDL